MKNSFVFFLVAVVCSSCSASGSRAYRPESGSFEEKLLEHARADLFPDEVRKDPSMYKETLVVWTGVVRKSEIKGEQVITEYEHHYWDWVEDLGPQPEKVFLSPQGEGPFRCVQQTKEFGGRERSPLPPAGYLAIAYGIVTKVSKDGTIELRCPAYTKTLGPEKFSTNIWSYGRAYVLKGDKSDFKVLRVPGPGL